MVSLSESVSKSKQWRGWVGSQTDLRRVLRLIEKQYEPLIDHHVSEETKHPRYRQELLKAREVAVLRLDDPTGALHAELKADLEEAARDLEASEQRAKAAGQIDLTLTGDENERRSVTGSADELVEYMEGRRFRFAEFSAPSGSIRNHSIRMRADRSDGLYLQVSAKDAAWCIAGFSELSDEINRQVPRWYILRSWLLLWLTYLVASIVGFWLLGDLIAMWTMPTHKFTGPIASIVAVLYFGLIGVLPYFATEWTRKAIPAFEITQPGGRSRGRLLVAALGSATGAVLLSVIGNAVSQAVLR